MKTGIKLLFISLLISTIPTPSKAFFSWTPSESYCFSAPAQSFWTWRTLSLVAGLSAAGVYGFYRWYTKKPTLPTAFSSTPTVIPKANPQQPFPSLVVTLAPRVSAAPVQQGSRFSFWQWKQICDNLPYYKKLPFNFTPTMAPGFTHAEFERTLEQFSQVMAKGNLSDPQAWLKGYHAAEGSFFDLSRERNRDPYVQKYECSEGSIFILHGDLHGDVHSLVTSLADYIEPSSAGFTLKPGIKIIFLGDYVDRGLYGCECVYILMRLKLDNPDRVFLLRGNHETRLISSSYGFKAELSQKGFSEKLIDKIFRFYNLLPVALYLGSHGSFVQCCHGGLEVGFDAGPLLNAAAPEQFQWVHQESCYRLQHANQLGITPCCSQEYLSIKNPGDETGFMWSDFIVDPNQQTFDFAGRGLNFSCKTTTDFLKITNEHGPKKLRGILRAHQHSKMLNPMMSLILDHENQDPANKGIAKLWKNSPKKGNNLWDNIVVTFNVSPDTPYGDASWGWPGFNFDTIGTLTINGPFEQWTLDITRKIIS